MRWWRKCRCCCCTNTVSMRWGCSKGGKIESEEIEHHEDESHPHPKMGGDFSSFREYNSLALALSSCQYFFSFFLSVRVYWSQWGWGCFFLLFHTKFSLKVHFQGKKKMWSNELGVLFKLALRYIVNKRASSSFESVRVLLVKKMSVKNKEQNL